MKRNAILVVTSLLSILLLTLHVTDEGSHGGITFIRSAQGLWRLRQGPPR